ncbi:hypothetical protein MKW98_021332 [Papaver atlanticum]|uniref:Uncharacterized protein n=1 Tax=Papaver atlanticum TaxID=357466 RepID=A0AAD4XIQ0_9MAGN|nr:hypothetical protein MKW98_021332 [Papaver atlanticum]
MNEPTVFEMLIKKVINLHERCMLYVTTCFDGHTLFHKAFKGAFEVFSTRLLLAAQVQRCTDKVVKVLAYISDKDLFAEFYSKKKLAHQGVPVKHAHPGIDWELVTMLYIQLGSTVSGLKSKGVVVVVEKSITSLLLLSFFPNHFLLHKLVVRLERHVYANIQKFIPFQPTVNIAALRLFLMVFMDAFTLLPMVS